MGSAKSFSEVIMFPCYSSMAGRTSKGWTIPLNGKIYKQAFCNDMALPDYTEVIT